MTQSTLAYWEERARELNVSEGHNFYCSHYTGRFGDIDLIALDSDTPALMEVL